jgi:hypothetical protein
VGKKIKKLKHPQVTGGEAGRGPGRGGNKLSSTRPEKYGTTPGMPVRPITRMPPPIRPKDIKKKKKDE